MLPHPFDVLPRERDFTQTVNANLQMSPDELKLDRRNKVKMLTSMKAELQDAEAKLRSSMAPSVERVLKGKALALIEKLINLSGHPDKYLVRDLVKGMDVIGKIPSTGVFKPAIRPAILSLDDLKRHGVWIRRSTLSRRPASDQTMAAELWAETLREVDRGHLR
eukprot:2265875-Amphidinium_carterae.1